MDKEERIYKRWKKQYDPDRDLTHEEYEQFMRWKQKYDRTHKPLKKKQYRDNIKKVNKPPKREGFWNKVKGVVNPTDEEIEYQRYKKLQSKIYKKKIAKLDKEISSYKKDGRRILDGTPSMLTLGEETPHSKKNKRKNIFDF